MTALRTIIFTILVPGTIAGLLPYQLAQSYSSSMELGAFRFVGVGLMIAGCTIYALCAFRFLVEGGGTPAIWFTRSVSFLIGEEPRNVITSGLYHFSRNPMYSGVVMFVLGEGIWSQKSVLPVYAAGLWAGFHLVVVFLEEPHLMKKMGQGYARYMSEVPRWIRLPFTTRR